ADGVDVRSTGDQERVFEYREAGCDRAALQREPVWDYVVAVAGWFAHRPTSGGVVDEIKEGGSRAGGCSARRVRMSLTHRGAGGDLRMEGGDSNARAGARSAGTQSWTVQPRVCRRAECAWLRTRRTREWAVFAGRVGRRLAILGRPSAAKVAGVAGSNGMAEAMPFKTSEGATGRGSGDGASPVSTGGRICGV